MNSRASLCMFFRGAFNGHLCYKCKNLMSFPNFLTTWHFFFQICCSFVSPPLCQDGKSWWIPAAVTPDIYDRSSSNLLTTECTSSQITGVRYAWLESPCTFKKCAIYDIITDLPMPPYTFSDEGFLRLVKKMD